MDFEHSVLLDGVWISFYRYEKKINAVFCIKVHFSIINLCKQSPMGNKKRKLYYFAQEKGKIFSFFLQKQALRSCQCQSLNGKKVNFPKICHPVLDFMMMPKFLHNILRVTLVSTGLVKLLLLAKHLSLLSVWSLLRRLIVRSFFTTPSNVCW